MKENKTNEINNLIGLSSKNWFDILAPPEGYFKNSIKLKNKETRTTNS